MQITERCIFNRKNLPPQEENTPPYLPQDMVVAIFRDLCSFKEHAALACSCKHYYKVVNASSFGCTLMQKSGLSPTTEQWMFHYRHFINTPYTVVLDASSSMLDMYDESFTKFEYGLQKIAQLADKIAPAIEKHGVECILFRDPIKRRKCTSVPEMLNFFKFKAEGGNCFLELFKKITEIQQTNIEKNTLKTHVVILSDFELNAPRATVNQGQIYDLHLECFCINSVSEIGKNFKTRLDFLFNGYSSFTREQKLLKLKRNREEDDALLFFPRKLTVSFTNADEDEQGALLRPVKKQKTTNS